MRFTFSNDQKQMNINDMLVEKSFTALRDQPITFYLFNTMYIDSLKVANMGVFRNIWNSLNFSLDLFCALITFVNSMSLATI